jgi:hypothetical protein
MVSILIAVQTKMPVISSNPMAQLNTSSTRSLLAAVFLSILPLTYGGEISWNVRLIQTSAEGILLQRAAFSDGEKDYGLSIDSETTAEVIGSGTRFTFKGVPSATFEIQPSPIAPVLPINGETIERYRAAARMRIPSGVGSVTNLEETLDPLNINRWQSFRVAFTFSQHGQKVRKSVTFLTLANGQQALIETSAYEAEYGPAMERSEYLIRSWHELVPKAVPPAS